MITMVGSKLKESAWCVTGQKGWNNLSCQEEKRADFWQYVGASENGDLLTIPWIFSCGAQTGLAEEKWRGRFPCYKEQVQASCPRANENYRRKRNPRTASWQTRNCNVHQCPNFIVPQEERGLVTPIRGFVVAGTLLQSNLVCYQRMFFADPPPPRKMNGATDEEKIIKT